MAECQISGMADLQDAAKQNDQTYPVVGNVGEKCRKWLVHEDGALAYRLQNEEINSHYGANRNRNAQLREDIPTARGVQIAEDEEAARIQAQYERMLLEQEEAGAEEARRLAEKMEIAENQKRRESEVQDQLIARRLQEEERRQREVRRRKWEKKQVEREAAHLGIPSEELLQVPRVSESDMSDLLLQPTEDMDEIEARRWQEDQDAELARLLQDQETKRGGGWADRNRFVAIEAQDRELAKVLQEQEEARARRARERAREKAKERARQQRQAQTAESTDSSSSHTSSLDAHGRNDDGGSSSGSIVISKHRLPDPEAIEEIPDIELTSPNVQTTTSSSHSVHELPDQSFKPTFSHLPLSQSVSPSHTSSQPSLREPLPQNGLTQSSPLSPLPPTSQLTNVAMALDPTYKARCYDTGRLQAYDDEDSDGCPVPPYMPIQGQRRTSSMEKKHKKRSKDKTKDGCKQQ